MSAKPKNPEGGASSPRGGSHLHVTYSSSLTASIVTAHHRAGKVARIMERVRVGELQVTNTAKIRRVTAHLRECLRNLELCVAGVSAQPPAHQGETTLPKSQQESV
jgi:hypothetical protein